MGRDALEADHRVIEWGYNKGVSVAVKEQQRHAAGRGALVRAVAPVSCRRAVQAGIAVGDVVQGGGVGAGLEAGERGDHVADACNDCIMSTTQQLFHRTSSGRVAVLCSHIGQGLVKVLREDGSLAIVVDAQRGVDERARVYVGSRRECVCGHPKAPHTALG